MGDVDEGGVGGPGLAMTTGSHTHRTHARARTHTHSRLVLGPRDQGSEEGASNGKQQDRLWAAECGAGVDEIARTRLRAGQELSRGLLVRKEGFGAAEGSGLQFGHDCHELLEIEAPIHVVVGLCQH